MRKVKLACTTWEQVQRLCDDQSAGKNHMTVPASADLRRGDRLILALRLPDELVLSIITEVAAIRIDPVTEKPIASLYLVGLTPEVCTRMRAMCVGSSGGMRLSTYVKKPARPAPAAPAAPADRQVIGAIRPRRIANQDCADDNGRANPGSRKRRPEPDCNN